MGNLTYLAKLTLFSNQLSGCVPEGLRNVEDNDFSALGLPFCGTDEGDETTDEGDETPDKAALVALYEATDGDNWTNNTNWLSDRPLGEWHGVTTDAYGRVTLLLLHDNQLSGAIPAELGNLANLQFLRLADNQLSGAIPAELGNLANLTTLWLFSNQLSGAIPAELGNLTNLTKLWLFSNQLSGAIPAELGNLTNLQDLYLYDNQLSGAIPAELGNLANLTGLALDRNQLSGAIPVELGNLANLQYLFLRYNQLSGAIPAELGNLTNLIRLFLGYNQLSGCVPEGLWKVEDNDFSVLGLPFCGTDEGDETTDEGDETPDKAALVTLYNATDGDNWTNNTLWLSNRPLGEWHGVTTDAYGRVTKLRLGFNQLSGAIPVELGNLSNLQELLLFRNQLSGVIPAALGNMPNLQWLNLSGNQLSGAIPVELGNLSNLTGLNLGSNQLSGAIPAALGNLTNLQWLYLGSNQLSGAIPAALGNLPILRELNLAGNQLSGVIPVELGNLSNLTRLTLSENQLSGAIPVELGNLTNLTTLRLDSNQLSGAIPVELGNLANLEDLYLGSNQLSGCVPEGLRNVEDNDFDFSYSHFGLHFCGADEVAIATDKAVLVVLYNATDGDNWTNNTHWLSDQPLGQWHGVTTDADGRVTELILSENQLSGAIPAALGNMPNLEWLRLDSNQLSGAIPAALGNMPNLEWLYLGSNQLSGAIPATLGNLSNLTRLTLSENQLSGAIPVELGNLTNLQELLLFRNQLSGAIPVELGNLTNLTGLHLSENQLSGAIPVELGNLTNLTKLWLFSNQLSGAIPVELGNLTNLTWLDLSGNQLSGAIPAALGNLANLEWLFLGFNQLSGSIPAALGNLSNLRGLVLHANQLSGAIPAALGNLANLEWLFLEANALSGTIPSELGNLSKLTRLYLVNGLLSGCVPEGLRNVENNDFSGLDLPFCDEQGPTFNTPTLVTQHDDRVVVMETPGQLTTDPIDFGALTQVFFDHYEDAFDYLMFFSNLSDIGENRYYQYYGTHRSIQNTVQGTGRSLFSATQAMGSAGKLNAILHFPYNSALLYGPSLHEIMHSWANYAIPTVEPVHWGFSSANGQLGGFDHANLIDHGGGRYSAGSFGTFANGGNSLPYSPIELYFAGLIPPSEVPALWVAEDGAWSNEQTDSGYQIFTASQVSTWSIDRIVAEHGARIPDSNQSQKDFRAALILLVDSQRPAAQSTLDELSSQVKTFTHVGRDDDYLFNFWEATGGRATLTMDGLSSYRRSGGAGKRTVSYRIVEPIANQAGSIGCVPMDDAAEGRQWMVAPAD